MSAAADAAVRIAAHEFASIDEALCALNLRMANDDAAGADSTLNALMPRYNETLDQVAEARASSAEGIRAKAKTLRRLLDADGAETRAELLALSLVADILRRG